MMTSSADLFLNFGCGSTGMPRPLSATDEEAVGLEADLDPGGVAGDGLVHGVVDHLGEEVVQRLLVGAADVHAGAAADGLEPLQHLDVGGGIVVGGIRRSCGRAGGLSVNSASSLANRSREDAIAYGSDHFSGRGLEHYPITLARVATASNWMEVL